MGADCAQAAIERMRRALREFVVEGIRTNISWFDEILASEAFLRQGFVHGVS